MDIKITVLKGQEAEAWKQRHIDIAAENLGEEEDGVISPGEVRSKEFDLLELL